jgi:hypothetical protein
MLRRLTLSATCTLAVLAPSAHAAKAPIPDTIVHLAQAELAKGVREVPLGSDNSRDIARYRTAFAWKAPIAAWCGYFASYIAKTAGVPLGSHGEGIGYVPDIKTWARRTGRWVNTPHAGDLAVYRGHVGIVESVEGSMTTIISGNWSNRVGRDVRPRSRAQGFVRLAVGSRIRGTYAAGFTPGATLATPVKRPVKPVRPSGHDPVDDTIDVPVDVPVDDSPDDPVDVPDDQDLLGLLPADD